MLFNSFNFIIFFVVVVGAYFVMPQRLKKPFLLLASCYFYMCWNAKYIILIFTSIVITYFSGIAIGRVVQRNKGNVQLQKRIVLWSCIGSNLLILFVFKYANYFFSAIGKLAQMASIPMVPPLLNILLPVGISFYTFQALGYTVDVYRNDIKPVKNFIDYALFVSFFPQLVAGPIERSRSFIPQLAKPHKFEYISFCQGLKVMLWGFFLKLVIADRAAVAVNSIYNNLSAATAFEMLVATFLFAFQIYCDFAGYSYIAIGCAQIFGYKLMNNFNMPYFAHSVKDFWSRWHISLSTWFKDYVYIPLGGNRKGEVRTCINIAIVFIVSGLWHGAGSTFVIWGCLHAVYQIIETLAAKRIKLKQPNIVATFFTFVLVDIAWIFFRSNSIGDAIYIFKSIFSSKLFENGITLANTGLDNYQLVVLAVALAMLYMSSLIRQKTNLLQKYSSLPLIIRWTGYIAAIYCVLYFGYYNYGTASQFVYFQF